MHECLCSEHVTYILGSLGAWLGFSVVGINPIPDIFRIKSNKVTALISPGEKLLRKSVCKFQERMLLQKQRSVTEIRKLDDSVIV